MDGSSTVSPRRASHLQPGSRSTRSGIALSHDVVALGVAVRLVMVEERARARADHLFEGAFTERALPARGQPAMALDSLGARAAFARRAPGRAGERELDGGAHLAAAERE